eukprot:11460_1
MQSVLPKHVHKCFRKCEDYTGEKHQARHSKRSWFRGQLYSFIYHHKLRTNITLKPVEEFFRESNCEWKPHTINYELTRIKQKALSDVQYDPPTFLNTECKKQQSARASQLAYDLSRESSNENVRGILNHLHRNTFLPDVYTHLPVAECVETVNEIHAVLHKLQNHKSDEAKIMRETLLSAMTILDKKMQIISPTEIRRRMWDCKCMDCLNFEFDKCENARICGTFESCNMRLKTADAIWINDGPADTIVADNADNDTQYCWQSCKADDEAYHCRQCS